MIEINEKIQKINQVLIKRGYTNREETYRKIEIIFYLVAITRYNKLKMDLKNETSFDRYFSNAEKLSIDVETIKTNLMSFGTEVDDLYCELLKLTEPELIKIFEYVENKKTQESGRHYLEPIICPEVNTTIFEILGNIENKKLVDICSGEGRILSEASKRGCSVTNGYEININATVLLKIRAAIYGFEADIILNDVLQEKMDAKYDIAITQPPFALRSFEATVEDNNSNLKYGESERINRADWHFVFKVINSINEHGKAIALITSGSLFNTPDIFYRSQIIKNKLLEMVIELPQGIYSSTNVATCLLVFSHNNNKIVFIDARDCFIKSKGYDKKIDVESVMSLINTESSEKVAIVDYENIDTDKFALNVNKYLGEDLSEQIMNPVLLKECAEVIPGYQYTTRRQKELEPGEGNVSVVKITNIINSEIDFNNLASLNIEDEKIVKYILKENDILVSTKGTTIKFALVKDVDGRLLIAHTNMSVIRCNEKLEPLYLISFLSSDLGQKLFKSIQTGAIIMNITQKAIENLKIPMIEKETQELIASRYKIISKNIVEMKEKLKAAQDKLSSVWEEGVIE